MSGSIVAPAPWNIKARSWQFLVEASEPKKANFPAGWACSWQADALAAGGEFIGGPALVILVQYSDTPVGPYDELGYSPGRFRYADGTVGFRTTIMFVSSKDSVWNGRKNWNIPKQVASFNYKHSPNGSWSLSVSQPDSKSSTPFFNVTVNPIPILSRIPIPFNSKLFGSMFSYVQPPLPQGPLPEEAGTEKWAVFSPTTTGWIHLVNVVPELTSKSEKNGKQEKVAGDAISFPAVKPKGLGMVMENMEIDLGPSVWKDSV
ncbi:hypothetical protein K435DRAFT_964800 [Dendrothele bispora CBS 962.96]|uniref:Uncharacterized protein n=1 Tax=Dendrothele bispora (strain CBS 962.96) TaxID=1314807 RepID=A0A4S8M8J1_DENBC|nr:hypothetical protein K435DRAFT_964800 [Dendrothele bispora CBS 962.96]